jgi:hypothetical protein
MDLDESKLRAVPDAGVLYTLPNGISIVWMKKHEPKEGVTDKKWGSKFFAGTTLKAIVEMTAKVLIDNRAQPGTTCVYNVVFEEPIGVSMGKRVRGLRVTFCLNGTLAHAYPVNENEL